MLLPPCTTRAYKHGVKWPHKQPAGLCNHIYHIYRASAQGPCLGAKRKTGVVAQSQPHTARYPRGCSSGLPYPLLRFMKDGSLVLVAKSAERGSFLAGHGIRFRCGESMVLSTSGFVTEKMSLSIRYWGTRLSTSHSSKLLQKSPADTMQRTPETWGGLHGVALLACLGPCVSVVMPRLTCRTTRHVSMQLAHLSCNGILLCYPETANLDTAHLALPRPFTSPPRLDWSKDFALGFLGLRLLGPCAIAICATTRYHPARMASVPLFS